MPEPRPRPEAPQMVHISSAVLQVAAAHLADVEAGIAALNGCEVALRGSGKLIVIIEGPTSGAVGEKLARMALLEGVHSACMVYEQAEPWQSMGETA